MENKKRGMAEDTRTIDTGDDYAVAYWIEELKTTKNKLLEAIGAVGNSFPDVKKQLKKN